MGEVYHPHHAEDQVQPACHQGVDAAQQQPAGQQLENRMHRHATLLRARGGHLRRISSDHELPSQRAWRILDRLGRPSPRTGDSTG